MTGMLVTFGGTADISGVPRHDFSVQSLARDLPERLDASLPETPEDPLFVTLGLMVSDPTVDTACLTAAGRALLNRLRAHENGALALDATLAAPPGAAGREVRLHIPLFLDSPHNLPWETLWDAKAGFLEMTRGVPVLRVVPARLNATPPSGKLGPQGLQVAAVLAARGIDGLSEYRALRAALNSYGEPWRLKVFSPDATVASAIAAEPDDRIALQPPPASAAALMREIAADAPNIVHFFCHGIARPGSGAALEIATHLTLAGGEPVELSAYDLSSELPASAWLVTLNACSSGETPEGSRSVAAELVAAGVPFVTGMREPARSDVLNAFTRGFLSDALVRIARALARALAENAPQELRLGQSLHAGRGEICEAFRQGGVDVTPRVKEWSLPMLFTQVKPFLLSPGAAGDPLQLAELQSFRRGLAEKLVALAPTLDPAKIRAIDARIAELDAQIGALT